MSKIHFYTFGILHDHNLWFSREFPRLRFGFPVSMGDLLDGVTQAPVASPPQAICSTTCPTAAIPRSLITGAETTSRSVVYPFCGQQWILTLKSFLTKASHLGHTCKVPLGLTLAKCAPRFQHVQLDMLRNCPKPAPKACLHNIPLDRALRFKSVPRTQASASLTANIVTEVLLCREYHETRNRDFKNGQYGGRSVTRSDRQRSAKASHKLGASKPWRNASYSLLLSSEIHGDDTEVTVTLSCACSIRR